MSIATSNSNRRIQVKEDPSQKASVLGFVGKCEFTLDSTRLMLQEFFSDGSARHFNKLSMDFKV